MNGRRLALVVLLILAAASPALAADPMFSLSSSVNVSRGDYGTGHDSTLVYVPVTLGVTPLERVKVSLTIPYIYQSSGDVVITGGGVAARKGVTKRTHTTSIRESESGLGDILLKGEYVLLKETDVLPEIATSLKIKLPTADKDRGLGTGEFDETVGAGLSKTFMERYTAFVDLFYTFIGSPPGANLDNSFGWDIGAAYQITKPLSVFGSLEGSTAIAPGQADPLELRFGAEYKLTSTFKLTGSVTKGLTDGAADYGFGLGFGWRF